MGGAIRNVAEQLCTEKEPELQSLLSAAFVRLSQEASEAKNYQAVNAICAGIEMMQSQRPVLVNDLRPRVGVENRIPEFIEEALQIPAVPGICWWCCGAPALPELSIWPTGSSAACGGTSVIAWWNW